MTKTTTTTTTMEYDEDGRMTKEVKTVVESDGGNFFPTAPWGQPRYDPPTKTPSWYPPLWSTVSDRTPVLKSVTTL